MLHGAVIGIRGIGKWHGQMMRDTGRIHVAAVCDVDESVRELAVREFPGAAFYSDVEEMLDRERIDLAAIAVPHNLHAPLARACLSRGVSAVVEKPMATSYADAAGMVEAARTGGCFVTVFHNRRLDPWFLAARDVVRSGRLGRLFVINVAIGGPHRTSTWRGNKAAMGGVMFDWGAHLVDYALQLDGGSVKAVSGFIFRASDTPPEGTEDHGELRMYMASGAIANVTVSRLCYADYERFRLLGEKGTLLDRWQWSDQAAADVWVLSDDLGQVHMEVPYRKSNPQAYYDNVADHMEGKAELMVGAESAARVIDVLCTAERSSARGGAPLPLEGAG